MGEREFGRCRKGRPQRRARGGRGNGCHLGPICPTQRLTGPNGGRIVGGSMTEKNGFSLSTAYQNPAGRKVYGWAVPGFFLCPSAIGPSKVGAGASPQKAFGCQWQAKRSACPTQGWVKLAPPDRASTGGSGFSALRGDAKFGGLSCFFFRPSVPCKKGRKPCAATPSTNGPHRLEPAGGHGPAPPVIGAHSGPQAVTRGIPAPPAGGCTCAPCSRSYHRLANGVDAGPARMCFSVFTPFQKTVDRQFVSTQAEEK